MSGNVPLGAINALDRESLDLKSERAVANSPARGGELQGPVCQPDPIHCLFGIT